MQKEDFEALIIYKFGYSFNSEGLSCRKWEFEGFDEYRFYDDKTIQDWPKNITFEFDGDVVEDFLIGGLHWKIVSEKVRQVFLKLNVQGIQFLPVRVIYSKTGKSIGTYWVINVLKSFEKLERAKINNLDIFYPRDRKPNSLLLLI